MDIVHRESIKFKQGPIIESITTKLQKTYLQKVKKCCFDIKRLLIWLMNKIIFFLSKCSILSQIVIILIPFSIICVIVIINVHYLFYKHLYDFNFEKGIKEEFSDLYITEIDDLHSEVDAFVLRENYIDFANHLFFDIYYRELASNGLFQKKSDQRIFPNISTNSDTYYSVIDIVSASINSHDVFTIPKNVEKKNVDDREIDSIGEVAKIYYYMIPIILHGSILMNLSINKTFLIVYEFDDNKQILNNELFFTFPRNTDSFNENDNFTPNNYLINPLVYKSHFEHSPIINNSYYSENWFMKQDNSFREELDLSLKGYSEFSLAHLNSEYDGNINKSIIMSSQQNINVDDKHYMINIIFYFNQLTNEISKTKEYTTFIVKNNSDSDDIIEKMEKYSDNFTFVILKSDATEYTLTKKDSEYFHNGLYVSKVSHILNGINYDSFNLDNLYNPLNNYSTFEEMKFDLLYFSTLYLYKTLFQYLNYTIIKKERLEVNLYHFTDETKIEQICRKIDFSIYRDYLAKTEIDCWDIDNILYYDEEKFKNFSTSDSNGKIPYCGCLPLYCLENALTVKNDGFDNIILASKINMPSKCQNKFISYDNETDIIIDNSYYESNIYSFTPFKIEIPRSEYIKFQIEPLHQLPGYLFLIITRVTLNIDNNKYYLNLFATMADLLFIVILIPTLTYIVSIIIIYCNLKRFSIIIGEFKLKFELFVYQPEYNTNYDNQYHRTKIEENKKKKAYNFLSESISLIKNNISTNKEMFNENENSLLDYLFTIFCKHYKISLRDIEKYYQNKNHETKNELKIKMMKEKNELFELLALFSYYAPIFRLNLSLDYKMYKYLKIIKNYNTSINQMENVNKEQKRLTQNILYELLSTENIKDYGLITNFYFKYISNLNAHLKENSIQNCMFRNIINKNDKKDKVMFINENNNENFNDGKEGKKIKLILKKNNELIEIFKIKFEADDYLDLYKIENSFNFFLVNSYYKYLKLIEELEGSNS